MIKWLKIIYFLKTYTFKIDYNLSRSIMCELWFPGYAIRSSKEIKKVWIMENFARSFMCKTENFALS